MYPSSDCRVLGADFRSSIYRYRKNLKMLYIVHSTFFTRVLTSAISTGAWLVSPKFRKKLVVLDRISLLGQYLDLTQIDFPPTVLEHNASKEAYFLRASHPFNDALPALEVSGAVFGMRLADAMGPDGRRGLPKVVRDCTAFFYANRAERMTTHGLFRVAPSSARLKLAQSVYDGGGTLSLETDYAADGGLLVASLLKSWVRSLSEPLISPALYPLIRTAPTPAFAEDGPGPRGAGNKSYSPPTPGTPEAAQDEARDAAAIAYLRGILLPAIRPTCHAHVLAHVVQLLHDVARYHSQNEMDAYNLAAVVAPCLVRSPSAPEKDSKILVGRVPIQFPVPGASPFPASNPNTGSNDTQSSATLTMLLRLCIERYYEVFDELPSSMHPGGASGPVTPAPNTPSASASAAGSLAGGSGAHADGADASLGPVAAGSAAMVGPMHARTLGHGRTGSGRHQYTASSSSSHGYPGAIANRVHTRTPSHSHPSVTHSRTPSSVLSSSAGPGSLSTSHQSTGFYSPAASPPPSTTQGWPGPFALASYTGSTPASVASGSSAWPPLRSSGIDGPGSSSRSGGVPQSALRSDGLGSASGSATTSSSSRSSPNLASDAEELHTMASTATTLGKASASPPSASTTTDAPRPAAVPQPPRPATPASTVPKRQISFPSALSLAARKASAAALRAPDSPSSAVPPRAAQIPVLPDAPGLARIDSEGTGCSTPTTVGTALASSAAPPVVSAPTFGGHHRRSQSVSSSTSTPGRSTPVASAFASAADSRPHRRARGASISLSPTGSPTDCADADGVSAPLHLHQPLSPPPVAAPVPSMIPSLDRDTRNALMKSDAAFPTVSVGTIASVATPVLPISNAATTPADLPDTPTVATAALTTVDDHERATSTVQPRASKQSTPSLTPESEDTGQAAQVEQIEQSPAVASACEVDPSTRPRPEVGCSGALAELDQPAPERSIDKKPEYSSGTPTAIGLGLALSPAGEDEGQSVPSDDS